MGTIIRSTGVSRIKSGSAIELAADAARNCIESSGAGYDGIGLMINAGIYRDGNLCEPSVASLIQQKLGLNLDPVFGGTEWTFSFDLRDGAAGFISSCSTADAWLSEGDTKYALVVASDSHPSVKPEPGGDFPFKPAGAAVLLEHSDTDGFVYFGFFHEGEKMTGISGFLDFMAHGAMGRENITITIPEGYTGNLLEAVTHSVIQTVIDCSLDLSRCCIVTSQPEAGFSSMLAEKLCVDPVSVVDLYSRYGYIHSAATGTGLDLLLSGHGTDGRQAVICAAPGAGLGIATAVYMLGC